MERQLRSCSRAPVPVEELGRSPFCLLSAGLRCMAAPLSKITKQRTSTERSAHEICMMTYAIIRPYCGGTSKQFQCKHITAPWYAGTTNCCVSRCTLAVHTLSDSHKLQSLGRKGAAGVGNHSNKEKTRKKDFGPIVHKGCNAIQGLAQITPLLLQNHKYVILSCNNITLERTI